MEIIIHWVVGVISDCAGGFAAGFMATTVTHAHLYSQEKRKKREASQRRIQRKLEANRHKDHQE